MQAKSDAALAKKAKQAKAGAGIEVENLTDMGDLPVMVEGTKGGANKRLSVERIYQKKTQLEHILLRPDTYIGSVETVTQVSTFVSQFMNHVFLYSPPPQKKKNLHIFLH